MGSPWCLCVPGEHFQGRAISAASFWGEWVHSELPGALQGVMQGEQPLAAFRRERKRWKLLSAAILPKENVVIINEH